MAWVLNDPPPKFEAALAECQRYQKSIRPVSVYGRYGDGIVADAGNLAYINLQLATPLRATPTIKYTNNLKIWNGISVMGVENIVLDRLSTDICSVKVTFSGSLEKGTYVQLMSDNSTDSLLLLDANP